MEFLMTYGWAILVVLIAISALAYFGVLNPSRFLPESCTLVPGLSCVDHVANADGNIQLHIQNGMGQDLAAFTVTAIIDGTACTAAGMDPFPDSVDNTFIVDCGAALTAGSRLKADIHVTFTSEAGLDHTEVGQLVTKISPEFFIFYFYNFYIT